MAGCRTRQSPPEPNGLTRGKRFAAKKKAVSLKKNWSNNMSIFGSIVSAIFGHAAAKPGEPAQSAAPAASQTASAAPAQPSAGAGQTAAPLSREQLEDRIKKLADAKGAPSNWKESIVDLMKLLDLDSSLSARKQLAQELGYNGALDGSAAMNVWLHKEVMDKVAKSGGLVPERLKL